MPPNCFLTRRRLGANTKTSPGKLWSIHFRQSRYRRRSGAGAAEPYRAPPITRQGGLPSKCPFASSYNAGTTCDPNSRRRFRVAKFRFSRFPRRGTDSRNDICIIGRADANAPPSTKIFSMLAAYRSFSKVTVQARPSIRFPLPERCGSHSACRRGGVPRRRPPLPPSLPHKISTEPSVRILPSNWSQPGFPLVPFSPCRTRSFTTDGNLMEAAKKRLKSKEGEGQKPN
jgi:hypothetical protein